MLDCKNIDFSQVKSGKRMNKAVKLLGAKMVARIIGFALFLLGAEYKDIIRLFDTPYETFNSFIKRIWKDGIDVLKDRRLSEYKPEPITAEPVFEVATAEIQGDEVIIRLPGKAGKEIRMCTENKVVVKSVLLAFLQNKILDSKTVAGILGYTQSHILNLSRQLKAGSTEILFSKRQGNKQDYVFTSEVKAELIQQYAANAIVGKSTTSEVLASDLKKRCDLELSPRAIRHHIQKLGLKNMTVILPEIIRRLKKNFMK